MNGRQLLEDVAAWFERLAISPDLVFPEVARGALMGLGGVMFVHAAFRLLRKKGAPRPASGKLARLAFLVLFASTWVLAFTGLRAVFAGQLLAGYPLLIHVSVAGGFVLGLAGASLFVAPRSAFTRAARVRAGVAARLAFWGWLGAGGVAALTMLISMVPVLGQEEMHQMLTVHRYAGLAAAICGTLSGYLALMGRFGRA